MALKDVFDKDFFDDAVKWGRETSQKLIETVLFGKKSVAQKGGTATDGTGTVEPSGLKRYLPYALIGVALIAALFVFKKRK
jgi:hypothetical protein